MNTIYPTAQGDTTFREIDGSPEWHITLDTIRLTRRYTGPWTHINPLGGLFQTAGVIGLAMSDLPAGYFISDVKAKCLQKDGAGELTVEVENINNPGWNSPVFDLEWVALDRSIITNPRYLAGGAKALTAADQVDLARWQSNGSVNNANPYQYNLYNYDGSVTQVTLGANAQDAAAKMMKDETSYRYWYPVVTTETYCMPGIFGTTPTGWTCGKIENPSSYFTGTPFASSLPTGYTFVRAANRINWQRWKYTWRREWMGFDNLWIDPDLYPNL